MRKKYKYEIGQTVYFHSTSGSPIREGKIIGHEVSCSVEEAKHMLGMIPLDENPPNCFLTTPSLPVYNIRVKSPYNVQAEQDIPEAFIGTDKRNVIIQKIKLLCLSRIEEVYHNSQQRAVDGCGETESEFMYGQGITETCDAVLRCLKENER